MLRGKSRRQKTKIQQTNKQTDEQTNKHTNIKTNYDDIIIDGISNPVNSTRIINNKIKIYRRINLIIIILIKKEIMADFQVR